MSGILHGVIIAGFKISAFPTIQTSNSTNYTTTVSSPQNFNLPSGLTSGDLLLLFIGGSGASHSITTPSGWTQLSHNAANIGTLGIYYKISDGSEGATVSISFSGSFPFVSGKSYRITNYSGTPSVGTNATGVDNSPNPPNLSPGSSDKYLWFASANCTGTGSAFTAAPAGYTDDTIGSLGISRRTNEASSEDPGTFTTTSSDGWNANTVAVRGS